MAGDRQHILPRFLLKGFGSRIEGKEIYTYVYRKGEQPFETNIKNAAVGRNFYEIKGKISVDEDITKFEGEYAPLLDELRSIPEKKEISDPRIANLITHIVARTKYIRDSFRESSEFFFLKIYEYFLDFDNIKLAILTNPEFMRNYIDEKLNKSLTPQVEKDTLRLLIPLIFPAFLDTQKAEMRQIVLEHIKIMKRVAPKGTKEGHIKGLSQSLTPEPRVNSYRILHWFLIDSELPLILGDIGCLFEFTIGRRFRSIDFGEDKINNVFLPIANKKLLIGTSLSTIPHVDINLINGEIAKCTREFFISSKRSDELLSLIPLIGSKSELISKEELKQIANEIVKNIKLN
jgi:hypothetical protein